MICVSIDKQTKIGEKKHKKIILKREIFVANDKHLHNQKVQKRLAKSEKSRTYGRIK